MTTKRAVAAWFWLVFGLGLLISCANVSAAPIVVVNPNAPSPLAEHPLLVTAVPIGPNPGFVELYNQSDSPINLRDYSVRFVFDELTPSAAEHDIPLPDIYLLDDSYAVMGHSAIVANPDIVLTLPETIKTQTLSSVWLLDNAGHEMLQVVVPAPITKALWLQRKTGSSGLGTTISSMATKDMSALTLRGGGLYGLPNVRPGLRIVEIVANHKDCSPIEVMIECGDYVKIHNPSEYAIDLSSYRLRSDSGSSTSGNAFSLDFIMSPGEYRSVNLKDDGDALSLTNTGGYVWIEDQQGIVRYDETITTYPDASSATKVGSSWMYDASSNAWLWSLMPRPDGGNELTVMAQSIPVVTHDELAECPAGKYRNAETNRCRTIEEAIATLAACDEGQERNPSTNRCRSVSSGAVASSLVPCDEGQERNPVTNRCRSILASVNSFVPCDPGEERNPETNRCRKINGVSSVATPATAQTGTVAAAQTTGGLSPQLAGWIVGTVIVVAAGYAVYEWRSEVRKAGQYIAGLLKTK